LVTDVLFQWWKLKDDIMTYTRKAKVYVVTMFEAAKTSVIAALKSLWEDGVQKYGKEIITFVEDKIAPLHKAFDGIKNAIDAVKTALGKLAKKARNLHLPDWMIPGSPPPLEIGLRGIADALADVNAQIGDFQLSAELPAAQGEFAFAGGGQVVIEKVQLGENVVIPNMGVGRAMVNQLMDEMGKATRVRRTAA
jgi:hypothetical protein